MSLLSDLFGRKEGQPAPTFATGADIGQQTYEDGILECNHLNSTQQHYQDAEVIAKRRYPEASDEDVRTLASGIMHQWSKHKNWQH